MCCRARCRPPPAKSSEELTDRQIERGGVSALPSFPRTFFTACNGGAMGEREGKREGESEQGGWLQLL